MYLAFDEHETSGPFDFDGPDFYVICLIYAFNFRSVLCIISNKKSHDLWTETKFIVLKKKKKCV